MSNLGYKISLPTRRDTFMEGVAKILLRLLGWRVAGDLPDTPKFVLVVAPHTSNWDFPIGLICAYALGLTRWPYGYMMKLSVVKWPVLGWFMKSVGGIPIDRGAARNVVEQMAAIFQQHERLMLAITPEGTRSKTHYWKSGFYHIAKAAGAPIVLAFLDYGRKVGGLGPVFIPSGDAKADLDAIRQFYTGITAKHPDQVGEIRFKDEEASA